MKKPLNRILGIRSSHIRWDSSRFISEKDQNHKQFQNSLRFSSMFYLTTIAHPTSDTSHPLLLLQSHHGDRYFFGKMAEGSQRCLTESRTRIGKLQDIFLTGELNWSSLGGLPGMILTIADQGKANLKLHYGNDLINYVVSTWRYFVFRFGISLQTNTMKDQEIYSDGLVRVKSIVVSKSSGNDSLALNERQNMALKSIVANMFPKNGPTARYDPSSDPLLNVELPTQFNVPKTSTCFEIVFEPVRGKFRPDIAVKLGVPKGPSFGKLASGQSITLEDGSQITPEKVLEKQRQFPRVLILDIPDDFYIEGFREKFKDYSSEDLGIVYFFLGGDVTINSNFVKLMELFGNEAQMFVSHPKVCPNSIVFKGAALTVLKLKALLVKNFNLPQSNSILSKEFYECFNKPTDPGTTFSQSQEEPLRSTIPSENVHPFSQGTMAQIESFTKGEEPMKIKVESNPSNWSWDIAYKKHVKPLNLLSTSFEKIVTEQQGVDNFDTPEKKNHVEVITLGTGSALPSKYRNVLSTLVKIPYKSETGNIDSRIILLDAGENTLGTIRRHFPSTTVRKIFENMKLMYLSHLHADHHLGIISILKEWFKFHQNDEEIIYVITPWQYNRFVNEWLLLEDTALLSRIRYISCEHFVNGSYVRRETKPIPLEEYSNCLGSADKKRRKLEVDGNSSLRDLNSIKKMYKDLRILNMQTCRAKHCDWAYSNTISFFMSSTSKKLFKLSYSGDTRPNIEQFSRDIGKNSDLLIHEATLDNELIEDAIKKKHCTINEAIEVSNEMNAQKLILTHFSQRYPKAPQVNDNIRILAKEYCYAFDGMIVDYKTLGEQKSVFEQLNQVFMEERKEEEDES